MLPMGKKIMCLFSWETYARNSCPTTQCQVGPYLASNRLFIFSDILASDCDLSNSALAKFRASATISSDLLTACSSMSHTTLVKVASNFAIFAMLTVLFCQAE